MDTHTKSVRKSFLERGGFSWEEAIQTGAPDSLYIFHQWLRALSLDDSGEQAFNRYKGVSIINPFFMWRMSLLYVATSWRVSYLRQRVADSITMRLFVGITDADVQIPANLPLSQFIKHKAHLQSMVRIALLWIDTHRRLKTKNEKQFQKWMNHWLPSYFNKAGIRNQPNFKSVSTNPPEARG